MIECGHGDNLIVFGVAGNPYCALCEVARLRAALAARDIKLAGVEIRYDECCRLLREACEGSGELGLYRCGVVDTDWLARAEKAMGGDS